MQDKIDKLILEYNSKIASCDNRIRNSEVRKETARRSEKDDEIDEIRQEIHIINAQRQAYFQAKVDIDSLLDYV